jgi:hypothetical protein
MLGSTAQRRQLSVITHQIDGLVKGWPDPVPTLRVTGEAPVKSRIEALHTAAMRPGYGWISGHLGGDQPSENPHEYAS